MFGMNTVTLQTCYKKGQENKNETVTYISHIKGLQYPFRYSFGSIKEKGKRKKKPEETENLYNGR